ncbi:MAG: terminase family protein [Bacteroidales bacterium]|nr:terminase family protein [Bacteroidales bacterium]
MTEVERKKEILKLMRKRAKLLAPHDFAHFLAYANPKYHAEWFHQLIARRCQDVLEGQIKNLMVFIPPQHGKSEIISRMFPAWALGRNPDLKIVSCSYSSDLSQQFSRSVQRIIDTKDYAEIFPGTYISGSMVAAAEVKGFVRNVDFFETVGHRGFYKAVGVGGSLTGTPVDIAIIDDPVKDAAEANSTTYRQRVWDWYNTVLSTRLHNESRQLFIMTRWHEDDLAGRILRAEPNEWQVLSIPAICEAAYDNGLSHRKIGEALWPQRHSLEKLEKQKIRAPREFSALYQQHPTIEGGNIVKRDWFSRISLADFKALRFREPMHFYLDTAYNKRKKGQDNDPSGILAACRINNQIYVYKAQRVWKEMPDLLRFIPEFMGSNLGNEESILHVEPKANGISVVQMLRELSTLNVRQTPTPQDDKEVRLRVVSPRIETGRVTLVDGSWVDDFLDEVCGFPTQPHDEFVDILGYAINDLYNDGDELPPDVDIDDLFSY